MHPNCGGINAAFVGFYMRWSVVGVFGMLSACGGNLGPGADSAVAEISWHEDVRPIFESNCVSCHEDGAIGSFALDTYESVYALRAYVADSVETRRMPPWKPDEGCRELEHDISMSQEDIDTILAWIDAGAPEGDPDLSVEGEAWETPSLSRVDTTLSMPAEYSPARDSADDYRCFALDWPYEQDMYVTGYLVKPGNASAVHHVIAYVISEDYVADLDAADPDGEGYTCFGGPGVVPQENSQWLAGWAPGGFQGEMPEGVGLYVAAGSKIALQIHYNLEADDGETDLTSIDVMVEESVEHPARIQPWTNPTWLYGGGMTIPANSTGTSHEFSYAPPIDIKLYTGNLHMHELGKTGMLSMIQPDGTEDCLLSISDWDFEWQQTYRFTEVVEVSAGTTLKVQCSWDNPTDEDVDWGDGTADEMCLATMLMSY